MSKVIIIAIIIPFWAVYVMYLFRIAIPNILSRPLSTTYQRSLISGNLGRGAFVEEWDEAQPRPTDKGLMSYALVYKKTLLWQSDIRYRFIKQFTKDTIMVTSVISNDDFARQLAKATVGTRITLCMHDEATLDAIDAWYGHPKGIVLRRGRFVLLNDEEWGPDMRNVPLTEASESRVFACPSGVVILQSDGRLLLDGVKPISEMEAHKRFEVSSAVTRKEGRIFLAGDEKDGIEITEGEWDGWDLHPYGVMFRRGGEVTLVVTEPPQK
ncbi:MAG: hypothetical protein Q7R64_04555 [bacterium]|nr:hypothetical protein [bacterium]